MCKPDTVIVDPSNDVSTDAKEQEDTTTSKISLKEKWTNMSTKQKGVLFGAISLSLIVTAHSVTFAHSQSQRDRLGCDSLCIGSMTSARSTLMLIGSAWIGRLSDSKHLDNLGGGRKFTLFLGIAASAFGILLAGNATSIRQLWISMIPTALFEQSFNVLKALFGEYHDKSSSPAERAGSVGMLGMAAGLAFMIGPLIGTSIIQTYDQAIWVSVACLLIASVFTYLLPQPANNNNDKNKNDSESAASKQVTTLLQSLLPSIVPAARTWPAIFLMTARVCMGLSFHIFQTIWTVALKERFNFGPKDYGRYYAFIGLSFAISQGFLAKWLLKHFGNTQQQRVWLLRICSFILGGGRFLVYQTSNLSIVYCLYAAIVTALGIVNTIFTADTNLICDPDELGGLFGLFASVESLAGIFGPILGGILSKIDPVAAPLTAVVALYGIVFVMVSTGYANIIKPRQKSHDL